jgi:hypothetical protein
MITKMLDKLSMSGSLQLAMICVMCSVTMMVLEQCGYGPASKEFISFTITFCGYVVGKRAQGETT